MCSRGCVFSLANSVLLTLANKFSKRHVLSVFPFLFNSRISLRNPWALKAKYGTLLYPEPVRERAKYKDAVTSGTDVSDLAPKLGKFWDQLAAQLLEETQEAR